MKKWISETPFIIWLLAGAAIGVLFIVLFFSVIDQRIEQNASRCECVCCEVAE